MQEVTTSVSSTPHHSHCLPRPLTLPLLPRPHPVAYSSRTERSKQAELYAKVALKYEFFLCTPDTESTAERPWCSFKARWSQVKKSNTSGRLSSNGFSSTCCRCGQKGHRHSHWAKDTFPRPTVPMHLQAMLLEVWPRWSLLQCLSITQGCCAGG